MHPKGLYFLAFTEAWERFSYYGMSALLALYLVQQLLQPDHIMNVWGLGVLRSNLEDLMGPLTPQALASLIFGIYSAFVYLTPIAGGVLADRYWGARRTVLMGAFLLVLGHLAMAFDETFLLALVLLIMGTGLLKGNISAQVGALYPPSDDEKRTQGFIIFSVGISAGAMAGPIVCGSLALAYGWHIGFAGAAALMMLSMATYALGLRHLPPDAVRARQSSSTPLSKAERQKILALLAVIAITVFQTTAYNQSGNVGLIWISEHVDLQTSLGQVPEPWFPSFDALAGIIAAPLLIALWSRFPKLDLRPLHKIALGAAIAGVASLLLAAGALQAQSGEASWLWPLLAFVTFGIGYMHYWPTCLALVSRLAPMHLKGTMISVAFLAFFVANLLVGYVGTFYESLGPLNFWLINASIAGVGSVVALLSSKPLSKILDDLGPHPEVDETRPIDSDSFNVPSNTHS